MRRLPLFAFCLAVAAMSGCSAAARSQPANRSPSTTTTTTAKTTTTTTSTTGTNACTGTRGHRPVVLLYGTFAMTSWGVIDAALSAGGYCLYPFDYGNGGTGEIGQSAGALAKFVDDVLARTGAKRVSIIGHSQGGLVARYYIKFLGGDKHVDDLIALSPPNHGTTNPLVIQGATNGCEACTEQQAGSPFLANLNANDEAPAPVDYTVIQTRDDFVVIPYTSAFLSGPPDRVTNITLQDRCPRDFIDHVNIPSDPVALQWIQNALADAGPADPGFAPRC